MTLQVGETQLDATLTNLSETGAGGVLLQRSTLMPGATVELTFRLPQQGAALVLEAQVAWAVTGPRSDVGLRFTPGQGGIEAVARFVASFRARIALVGALDGPAVSAALSPEYELELLSALEVLPDAAADGNLSLVLLGANQEEHLERVLSMTESMGALPVVQVIASSPSAALERLLLQNPRLACHTHEAGLAMLRSIVQRMLLAHALELDNERLAFELESASARVRDEQEHTRVSATAPNRLAGVIGASPAMRAVYGELERVSRVDTPVFLVGETGTGKGLVAKALHALSPRARKAFVTQNCAAVSETLLDAELFGHVRGAFTGAVSDRAGLFEVANGGTVFLDEVAEMSAGMQAKLLNVLQDGELKRVGSAFSTHVDVRVICATHADLDTLVDEKKFREDLYYRLASFVVQLPPLRERVADIGTLAAHFLLQFAARNRLSPKRLSADALAVLEGHDWPGNVRQLQHAVERMALLSAGDGPIGKALAEQSLGRPRKLAPKNGPLEEQLMTQERATVKAALDAAGGVIADAARALGMERTTLSRRLKRLGLTGKTPRG